MMHESDAVLRERSAELRFRAKSGERPARLICEAFALVQEASHRILGMRHFDVQLIAGIHLASKRIVEMATGEGKTLTAMLPLYLHALSGKGAHLATANDYLARRDAEVTRPVFESLGITIGVVQNTSSDSERLAAYKRDITYGTCAEFGFDFLRDRMKRRVVLLSGTQSADSKEDNPLQAVRRQMHFILVDEADSIMIDDAGTPLIIGAVSAKHRERVIRLYEWAAAHAGDARESSDFNHIEYRKKIELTETGRAWVREKARQTQMSEIAVVDLYEYMERAIKVRRDYQRDRNYVVSQGKVTIVDNNTGRLAVGRHWQDGLHQAIEAHEGLDITVPTASAAQLTIQSLILSYPLRAGMTGTAWTSRREFRKVYKMRVVAVPTRLKSQRKRWPTKVFKTERDKMLAIRDEVLRLQQAGRSVLIGSRSVSKSELLSEIFEEAGIPHEVLNARHEDREAEIVARAGRSGRVTISTSMAGRGTDIKLEESVRARGGLHVVICELNDSARVDRQLLGRCARQGDPGSFRYFLSPDDHVMDPKNRTEIWTKLLRAVPFLPREWLFRGAQWQIHSKSVRDRLAMLHFEKKRLRTLKQAGLDPVLDVVG
jgi:preprotein translocase subunit SecA